MEDIKKYVDSIKDTPKFKKILEFTKMDELGKGKDIYEKFIYYLKVYHPIINREKSLKSEPDFEHFKKFYDNFLENSTEIARNENGYVDLSEILYLKKPLFFAKTGRSVDAYLMLTNGDIYISKKPLYLLHNAGIDNRYSMYSPLIAANIAKCLDVNTAEISLANGEKGYRILSKNFLKENEEIVEYGEPGDEDDIYISKEMSKIERYLELRKFSKNEIEDTKFEFLKQEFVAKLITLRDQHSNNSPIIVSVDEQGKKHVKMAPMFDYDHCFHISISHFKVRKCDNGESTISALIEQYKDYPGFMNFAQKSVNKLDMENVFSSIFKQTGIEKFKDYKNDEEMMKFVSIVNSNLKEARDAIGKMYNDERGEL